MATYLITAANRGIGYAYCQQLHDRGDHPIAVCRTPSAELTALGIQVIAGIDVTQDADAERLRSQLQGTPIDVLIGADADDGIYPIGDYAGDFGDGINGAD